MTEWLERFDIVLTLIMESLFFATVIVHKVLSDVEHWAGVYQLQTNITIDTTHSTLCLFAVASSKLVLSEREVEDDLPTQTYYDIVFRSANPLVGA